MTIDDLIRSIQDKRSAALTARADHTTKLAELRGREAQGESIDAETVEAHRSAKVAIDADIAGFDARIAELEAEKAADEAATRAQAAVEPTNVRKPAYDQVARVGQEKRTYNPANDKRGKQFLQDVGSALLGDMDARDRLNRHSAEETVERAGQEYRAAGTGAFTGLVVPQYLTDMYAPAAKANRPFADVINKHDLPASGMVVNISRITTATSAALQASENAGVSETNIDDTLLAIPVQTIAGQQTLSRQAIERGTGIEGAMMDDLFRSYATTLDSTLINQATTGLSAVATSVTYTDASPTSAELYPKLLESLSGVEGALLDQDPGDNVAVMHARRWYWLQSQVGTSWPFIQQPGYDPRSGGANFAERYGNGFRGVLPNGTPVIVDNNVATNLGAGTNEDEIYICSLRESHLWEDPSAPMMIRAEQTAAASLGVLFVVYGYIAYTHARYAQARKIAGTGLITPTWTGA